MLNFLNIMIIPNHIVVRYENIYILRKETLKCKGIMGYNVCNPSSNDSEKNDVYTHIHIYHA